MTKLLYAKTFVRLGLAGAVLSDCIFVFSRWGSAFDLLRHLHNGDLFCAQTCPNRSSSSSSRLSLSWRFPESKQIRYLYRYLYLHPVIGITYSRSSYTGEATDSSLFIIGIIVTIRELLPNPATEFEQCPTLIGR